METPRNRWKLRLGILVAALTAVWLTIRWPAVEIESSMAPEALPEAEVSPGGNPRQRVPVARTPPENPPSLPVASGSDSAAADTLVDSQRRQPESILTLTGKVLGALDESPIAGAEVSLKSEQAESELRSDSEGTFTARLPSAGRYDLSVTADGFFNLRRSGSFLDGVRPLVLYLVPELAIRGRVIDEESFPVADARVNAMIVRFDGMRIGTSATPTDSEGYFELGRLQGEGTYEFEVSHTLYTAVKLHVEVRADDGLLVLRLGPRHEEQTLTAIEGVVVDPEGIPIEGSTVMVHDNSGNWLWDGTTENGAFRTAPIRPGPTNIGGRAEGFVRTDRSYAYFDLDGTPVEPVTLVLQRQVGVSGRVVDEDGDPVEGVMLAFADRGFVTDENGMFEIAEIAPGRHRVWAKHRDFIFFETNVTVPPTDGFEFILSRGLSLTGTVLLDSEHPIEHLRVELLDISTGKPVKSSRLLAQSGRFMISGVEAGEYRLRVRMGERTVEGPLLLDRSREVRISVPLQGDRLRIEDPAGS